ncbi:site-specific integrase [Actinomadura harenae]|uniref:site-specific integrase n=1 Tax=Actinomadura harenae TaxID=2483351 RepID=UPI0018F3614C|nr:site-specific integrase [Actinomadura harenae]
MAATGSTFKSCGCRGEGGTKLGRKCPKLFRADGRWSPTHGKWNYQLEMPRHADGARRGPLRRSGYSSQADAEAEMNQARELLGIAGEDEATRIQIADLIAATIKETGRLPDPDEVRRKVRTRQDLAVTLTVAQFLAEWLAGRRGLSESSRRSYASHLKLYLVPHLGHLRLDRLGVADVDRMFDAIDELNELIIRARQTGDPDLRVQVKGRRVVGAATKQRIRATLRAALGKAIKQRMIEVNVAALVELPSGKAPKPLVWTPERITRWRRDLDTYTIEVNERRARQRGTAKGVGNKINRVDAYVGAPRPSKVMVWTPALTKCFLERAERHPWHALYYVIAFRGLRRGEGCGLRWSDVDLDAGTATVRSQFIQIGPDIFEGKPKTDAGEATISLDASTVAVLRAHKARQNTMRLAAGDAWHDAGLVFTDGTGQRLRPNEVTDQFERLSMEAGLPPVRLHDLRHGAASFLLAAGHDMKTVQETLRLSSITIAADTYTSLLPQVARKSAEDAAAIILNADAQAALTTI